jgi:hypothetical protein
MRLRFIVVGVALTGMCSAIGVSAKPQYKDVLIKAHKPDAKASKALSCATCHVSDSNFARNPYGKQQEQEMGKKKDLTVAILEKIAQMDADEDGTSNEDEIKAGTKPGDPKSGAAKKDPAETK